MFVRGKPSLVLGPVRWSAVLTALWLLCGTCFVSGQLVLSEFCADNRSLLVDDDGDAED
jgi:hypothetical protein